MVFFHFLKLLKSRSMWNITWKVIINLSCMISRQNFEIRTVLLQELPSCKDNFSRLSQFFSAQDSVHGFVTRLQNGIFHLFQLWTSSSMQNITYKIIFHLSCMILRKNFEIWTVLLRKRPSCTSLTIIAVFLSTGFSSRLCNLTLKWYFFISINYIEISINVGHYLENNI